MFRPYTHTHTLQHVTLTALQTSIPERTLRDLRKLETLKQLPPKKVARWRQQYEKDTTPAIKLEALVPGLSFG